MPMRDALALLPVLVLVAAGCESRPDVGPPADPRPLAVRIDGPAQILPNAEVQFVAIQSWSDGSNRDVTATAQWTSSNPSVLSVNGGSARALAAGEIGLTAQAGPFISQPKSVQVIPTTTEWNGRYTLTIEAGSCNESLPLPHELRRRIYSALIQQSGLVLIGIVDGVGSFGGRIANPQVRFFFDPIRPAGRRASIRLISLSAARHAAYPVGSAIGFTERFSDATRLVVSGEANTTMSTAGFFGSFAGTLSFYAPRGDSLLGVCQSSSHGFALVRQ